MEITATVKNIDAVRDVLAKLSGPQARGAYAKAINDTAFQVRRAMKAEMSRVFDRPTPYILNSSYVERATPEKLSARIAPENNRDSPGVDPQKILQAQEFGGTRRDKRSETAFRRVGILPNGFQMAIPSDPYPGSHDGRGNLRGPFVAQLISYFRASSEQGYSANMTDKRRRQIEKGTKKTWGRRYFVAYGRLRGGARMTRSGEYDQRASNLAPGIWATDGKYEVAPVVMFVRAGRYTPRLSMQRVADQVGVQDYLDKRVRFRVREAAGV